MKSKLDRPHYQFPQTGLEQLFFKTIAEIQHNPVNPDFWNRLKNLLSAQPRFGISNLIIEGIMPETAVDWNPNQLVSYCIVQILRINPKSALTWASLGDVFLKGLSFADFQVVSYKGLFPEEKAKFWPAVSLIAYCDAKALNINPGLSLTWANLADCFKKGASWYNLPDSSKINLFLSANLPQEELIKYCLYKKSETLKRTNVHNYHLENGRWSMLIQFDFQVSKNNDLINISIPAEQIRNQQTFPSDTSCYNKNPIEWDQPTAQNRSDRLYTHYNSKQTMPHTTSNYSYNNQNINKPNYTIPSNVFPSFSELVESLPIHQNECYSGHIKYDTYSVESMVSEQVDYTSYSVEPMVSEQADYSRGSDDTSLKDQYREKPDNICYDADINNTLINAQLPTTNLIPEAIYQKTFPGQTFFEPPRPPLKWEEPLEELYPNLMDPYYYNNN